MILPDCYLPSLSHPADSLGMLNLLIEMSAQLSFVFSFFSYINVFREVIL